jgi:hypothetical protein
VVGSLERVNVVGCLVSGFGGVLFSRTRDVGVSEGAKEQRSYGSHTSQARVTCNYLGRGQ